MPRTADHDARRRQIATAVARIVAADGFDAATVARVAASAGVSVGLVQHYFASKDELLLFAYGQVTSDIAVRLAGVMADGDARRQPISVIVAAGLAELLPLDERRRGEYRVARAFLGRALDRADLAAVAQETAADLRGRLSTAVTNGKECGEVEPGVDAARAATHVAALLDGLAGQLYLEPDRRVGGHDLAATARELLGACLAETFTGECRHYG